MTKCLICETTYEPFISFGKMPIANAFLDPGHFAGEYFFELQVGVCPVCNMVQLVTQPDREKMFHENYAFFSSTSAGMALHFEEFSKWARQYFVGDDPFVVEIGSNDGIMLKHFARDGIRHLGIEPSANVAQAAQKNGVHTLCAFFDEEVARQVLSEHGQADIFLAANVMCHIPYLHSVAEGIKILLEAARNICL